MLTNQYLDDLFQDMKIEGETYFYYFYTYSLPTPSSQFKYGLGSLAGIEHLIICFTEKRLIFLEITMMGKYTGNMEVINMDTIGTIKVKKGFFKTKITVTDKEGGGEMVINTNSFTFGLSNQKKNLKELANLYS